MKHCLLLTFMLILPLLLFSQKKGEQLYENLGYLSATDYLQDLEKEEMTYEIKLKLANSFRLNAQYEAAEYWYAQIISEVKENETILHYALCLQANGKCEDAIRWFNVYKEKSGDDKRFFVQNCEEIKQLVHHEHIKVTNVKSINSSHHDFSPIPYQNGLMFTSMRGVDDKVTQKKLDKWTKDNYSDLFFAQQKDTPKEFQAPEAINGEINGNFHDGVATFSSESGEMIFTRNSRRKSDQGDIKHLKIYRAQNIADAWKEVEELDISDKEFSTCHPALSADGQRLYFASNRPGGFGGMDLYVCQKLGSKWSEPQHLGPTVNTSGNEIFPFISANDKLFFASDGHKGMGGLDIFVVEKTAEEDENSWINRKNVGSPVNSKKDDFGFYIEPDEEWGYFSSNRPGGMGKDDIYYWEKSAELADKRKKDDPFDPAPYSRYSRTANNPSGMHQIAVCDAKTGKLLDNARVGMLESQDGWAAYQSMVEMPKSILTKNVEGSYGIKVKGGIVRADASFVTDQSGHFQHYLESDKTYSFYAERDYYFPNREQLTGAQIMENPDYCIPLVKRNCIMLRGVVRNKNFPKNIPGAEITFVDKCTGEITTMTSDLEGKFDLCIECNCEYEITARKLHFLPGKSEISTLSVPCNSSIIMNTAIELELDQIQLSEATPEYVNEYLTGNPAGNYTVGQEITLNNIYYDFDEYFIREDARYDLDLLVMLMNEYPSMEITLSAHTDSRGASEYNLWLSQKRANAAKEYLIEKGIASYRINEAAGYGEIQHVNNCYDGIECSEEEHQRNRRTVITITKLNQNLKINTIANPRVIDRRKGF